MRFGCGCLVDWRREKGKEGKEKEEEEILRRLGREEAVRCFKGDG